MAVCVPWQYETGWVQGHGVIAFQSRDRPARRGRGGETGTCTLREESGGESASEMRGGGSFPCVVQRNFAAYEEIGLVKSSSERISELENMIAASDVRFTTISQASLSQGGNRLPAAEQR